MSENNEKRLVKRRGRTLEEPLSEERMFWIDLMTERASEDMGERRMRYVDRMRVAVHLMLDVLAHSRPRDRAQLVRLAIDPIEICYSEAMAVAVETQLQDRLERQTGGEPELPFF